MSSQEQISSDFRKKLSNKIMDEFSLVGYEEKDKKLFKSTFSNFLGTYLEIGEHQLHHLSKEAQKLYCEAASKIGQPGLE